MIIECPLNDLFHDRRDFITMSQMAVINISLTVAVILNVGTSLLFLIPVRLLIKKVPLFSVKYLDNHYLL